MTSTPTIQTETPLKTRSFLKTLGWSSLAVFGGVFVYVLFAMLTGMEPSLMGIPVGLGIGQIVHGSSANRGGRWFQALAALLAFLAFDLTYVPGMADAILSKGTTVVTFSVFVFMTLASPVIDSHNGFIGGFMVLAGMYLAWKVARKES